MPWLISPTPTRTRRSVQLCLLADTHAELELVNRHVRFLKLRHGVEVEGILHAGDFGFWDQGPWRAFARGAYQFLKPMVVVHGNHEDPRVCARVQGRDTTEHGVTNLYLAKSGEFVDFAGLVILCVGGAKCVDNPAVRYPFSPDEYTAALESWRAGGSPAIDILLTHEAPSGTGMVGDPFISAKFGLNPFEVGEPLLRELWEAVKPKLHVCGHHHKLHRYTSPDGLQHLTLPVARDGGFVLDTERWELTGYALT
jgi:hypothetical protein